MINATSRASGKELASLTLGVSQSITNLQKAQVEVERFKAEEVALAKRQDKDVKKFEAGVVKNLKALEEEVKPDLTKEQKNAQVLQDLGPRSGYTEATDNLKAKAEALTAAESVLKEMQLRAKTSTGDNSEKAKFNVKVAEKAVTQAKEDKEDAEMTQEAEKEAMVAVASAIKNATKAKQAQKAEEKQKASEQKNLEAVSSQLAAAALLGDGAGMVDILKESMANETAAKIQEWPGSIRDGKRIGPIQAMSETSSPKLKKIYNETATKLVHDLEDNTLANEDSASNSTIY
jgi:hypothetical protein